MEDLNKTQMVLLCLLVSFVTSIGTGIITTSLLREVPQNVTQTINRVVERTVETVAPQNSNTNTVTRETTVVVKEEDLVIDSISKSRSSLVRILKSQSAAQSGDLSTVQTIGVVVKKDGTILTDKRFVEKGDSYWAVVAGSNEAYPVEVAWESTKTNAAFLTLDAGKNSSTNSISNSTPKIFVPISIGNKENTQLGQTVIAVGGREREAVAIGRVNSFSYEDISASSNSNASTTKVVSMVETDAPLRDLMPGSILLNLSGFMVGFENFAQTTNGESLYNSIASIRREKPEYFEPTTI